MQKKYLKNLLKLLKIIIFPILSIYIIASCNAPGLKENNKNTKENIILTGDTKDDITGNVEINYEITSSWSSGFTATVEITNIGSTIIDGWELTWSFTGGQQILSIWNASGTQTGNVVSITNTEQNRFIYPGSTVSFGFSASGEPEIPDDFILTGGNSSSSSSSSSSSTSSSNNGVKVDYIIQNQWLNGFTTLVTITNNTNTDILNWKLEWDYTGDQQITASWNVKFDQSGQHVTITPVINYSTIKANESFNFGIQGTYSGINDAPDNIVFTILN